MAKHYFILSMGVVAVSFGAIFTRLAEAPFLVIAVYRLALASLIISPVACIYSGKELRSLSKKSILLSLVAGFFLALHFAFWIASLGYTTVASSVVLVTSHPIFVALASYFLFHDSLFSCEINSNKCYFEKYYTGHWNMPHWGSLDRL